MTEYTVTWKIELDAEDPIDAAQEALDGIVNGNAQVFEVLAAGETEPTIIDLWAGDE